MKTIELKGTVRETVGKKNAKKVRKSEEIPCVIYGGEKNIHFSGVAREFKKIVYTPSVYIVKIEIEGKHYETIMQDIQFHPVTDNVLHIDFLEVNEIKPIVVKIPVQLEGFAKGVKTGGKLSQLTRTLKVKGLAKHLPDYLSVNIDDLELGKSIKVGELNYENIELLDSKNAVVASVKLTRAAKGMSETEAETPVKEEAAEKEE
jgi:large subunit ribosomal protein L25